MIIFAPAKVNLRLRVLNKRPDGYHNLETIFERIALADKIVLRSLKKDKIDISCDNPDVPVDKAGLMHRTASLLKEKFKITEGAEIRIFKKIPIASGLGGGSSDAASILKGLNKLWGLFLETKRLARLGAALGADIPFFLYENSFALAGGIGDRIKPLRLKNRFWHLLIYPPIKMLSKDVYNLYDKIMGSSRLTRKSAVTEVSQNNGYSSSDGKGVSIEYRNFSNKILSPKPLRIKPEDIEGIIGNDLEKAVIEKNPLVGEIKNTLKDIGCRYPLVSGSGPSVFTLFEERKEAARAKRLLIRRLPVVKSEGWRIFIVPTL